MADPASDPLTLEEAKLQLRFAARELSPRAYIARHPLGSLLTTAITGFVVGTQPRAAAQAATYLLSTLRRQRSKRSAR